jgi:hypothetical protein
MINELISNEEVGVLIYGYYYIQVKYQRKLSIYPNKSKKPKLKIKKHVLLYDYQRDGYLGYDDVLLVYEDGRTEKYQELNMMIDATTIYNQAHNKINSEPSNLSLSQRETERDLNFSVFPFSSK